MLAAAKGSHTRETDRKETLSSPEETVHLVVHDNGGSPRAQTPYEIEDSIDRSNLLQKSVSSMLTVIFLVVALLSFVFKENEVGIVFSVSTILACAFTICACFCPSRQVTSS